LHADQESTERIRAYKVACEERPRVGNVFGPVRKKERFLTFGAPAIEEAEIAEVVASLKSGWLGTGPKVAQFEKEFAAYRGAQHCVAVSSCTAALAFEHSWRRGWRRGMR
jgi:cystathionine beta-lyase/cystathionine gamma-synthase